MILMDGFAIASKARVVVLKFSPYLGPYENYYNFPSHLFNNQNSSHLQVLQLFYGPFQITERIRSVAYRLQLPASARLHDVFHVGLLKPFRGDPPSSTPALPPIHHGCVCVQPERMLHSRLARDRLELLVQWKGRLYADAE